MVIPGHYGGPAEPLDGFGDSAVVGGNHDPGYERSLLNAPVNVLYQCFSGDFGYRLSRETGGIESCGDDRNGGINLHQKHRTSWYHGHPGHRRSILTRLGARIYAVAASHKESISIWRVSDTPTASVGAVYDRAFFRNQRNTRGHRPAPKVAAGVVHDDLFVQSPPLAKELLG